MMCFIGVWLSQAVPTYQYFVYMRLSGLFSLCYEYQSCNLKQVKNSSKDVSNVFRATFISLQREYQITLHLKLEALWKTTATKATSEARAKEEAEQCGLMACICAVPLQLVIVEVDVTLFWLWAGSEFLSYADVCVMTGPDRLLVERGHLLPAASGRRAWSMSC